MNHQRIAHLRQFLSELIAGDQEAGKESLSLQFTQEEGMNRAAYLQHERDMFRRISALYGLERGWRVEVEAPPADSQFDGVQALLINADGDLVYEWAYALDEAGRLVGNGSSAQTVSKMQHVGGKWSRALAISSTSKIVSFRPLFSCAWQKRTNVSDDGLFWTFCFLPEQDEGHTFWGKFRIRYEDGRMEEKMIWLRGLDRPHFLNPNLALSENALTLSHDAQLPWSINVKFEDGSSSYLEFPRQQTIDFLKPVIWACLTDALDHDWIVSTSPIELLDF